MFGTGNIMMVILRVQNNTNEKINEVIFNHDDSISQTKLKNIKPNSNKQTGISTKEDIFNITFSIDESSKSFIVKEKIDRGCMDKLLIKINSINDTDCDYTVERVEY